MPKETYTGGMLEDIMREFFIKYKGFEEEVWDKFWQEYKKSPIVEDIETILNLYRQRARSACEFYLNYKDDPMRLVRDWEDDWDTEFTDVFEFINRFSYWIGKDKKAWKWKRYNDWLFKFAFKDVLGEEVGV